MDRDRAIQIINALYPVGSEYPDTNAIGEELLAQAKREVRSGLTWQDEPTPVLIRYAELCEQREMESERKFRRQHRI